MKYKHFVWFYLSMGKILCGTQAPTKFENILSFSQKRSPGSWKNFFKFFYVIFAYFGSFWVKIEKNPTLSLIYERIRIFWGKRTHTSWSINTLCDSICMGKIICGPQAPTKFENVLSFSQKRSPGGWKKLFQVFSCYYIWYYWGIIVLQSIEYGIPDLNWVMPCFHFGYFPQGAKLWPNFSVKLDMGIGNSMVVTPSSEIPPLALKIASKYIFLEF